MDPQKVAPELGFIGVEVLGQLEPLPALEESIGLSLFVAQIDRLPRPKDLVISRKERPFRQKDPLDPGFEILAHLMLSRFSNSGRKVFVTALTTGPSRPSNHRSRAEDIFNPRIFVRFTR